MPLYIGLFAKTRQQVNCDCDCDDMHRRVAITEVSVLGVRKGKNLIIRLLSIPYRKSFAVFCKTRECQK